jgi:hypothetical protein
MTLIRSSWRLHSTSRRCVNPSQAKVRCTGLSTQRAGGSRLSRSSCGKLLIVIIILSAK